MGILSRTQIDHFWRKGYVVAEDGATPVQLAAMKAQVTAWVEQSRTHAANWGETIDGRARFDLEDGHGAETPRLRRVANPQEVSAVFLDAIRNLPLVDMAADLIGPDVKFHHAKLNLKQPGMETRAGYHQDHPYDPHTNDDVVVTLLMLDDMTPENGCLRVLPGSHRGEHYSHWRGDRFTGEIAPEIAAGFEPRMVPVTGRAGSVCLMHTWTVHGSPGNASDAPRTLFICDYTAADALPLMRPAMPNAQLGEVVRGAASHGVRLKEGLIELPAAYMESSFFELQGQKSAAE
ncbi:MAG: phytanoyl-CoA dioxygenase family protein [Alphaproteobacteria bacterium]